MVGETGFEPATLCSQSRCATRLRHSPTSSPLTAQRRASNYCLFSVLTSLSTFTLMLALSDLVLDLVAGRLDVVADVGGDVLAPCCRRRRRHLRRRPGCRSTVIVLLASSLLTLQAPSSRSGMASDDAHGLPPCLGAQRRLAPFRLRLNPARQHGEHRRPRGDVLAKLGGIDLVERVVGRVVIVEIAGAVLVERDPRRAGL